MKRNDHGWKLVSDSGCSLLVPDGPDGLAGIDYAEVPFVISVDNTDYIDEPGIDIEKMLEHIANCRSGGRTSCPSPHAWLEAWGDAENVIAFTLSAALSGSYNSAIAARHMALEKDPDRNIAVINTCGAGELPEQLTNIIYEGIHEGDSFDAIVSAADKAVKETQVMFALGSLDNLIKAGRLNKLVGYAAHRFNISAIGVASPGGRIELRHKFRGMKKTYDKLIDTLRETGFAGGELVISHCMNEEGAEKLGHGTGYKYAHDYPNDYVEQQYLPYELSGREFYQPSGNGYEVKIREHMARIKKEAAEASSKNKES